MAPFVAIGIEAPRTRDGPRKRTRRWCVRIDRRLTRAARGERAGERKGGLAAGQRTHAPSAKRLRLRLSKRTHLNGTDGRPFWLCAAPKRGRAGWLRHRLR